MRSQQHKSRRSSSNPAGGPSNQRRRDASQQQQVSSSSRSSTNNSDARSSSMAKTDKKWVWLNVGGSYFQTSRQTLTRLTGVNSPLYRLSTNSTNVLFDRDDQGAYLIDRDPAYFNVVLNYLRHGQLIMPRELIEEGVMLEAEYFNIPDLQRLARQRIDYRGLNHLQVSLQQKQMQQSSAHHLQQQQQQQQHHHHHLQSIQSVQSIHHQLNHHHHQQQQNDFLNNNEKSLSDIFKGSLHFDPLGASADTKLSC